MNNVQALAKAASPALTHLAGSGVLSTKGLPQHPTFWFTSSKVLSHLIIVASTLFSLQSHQQITLSMYFCILILSIQIYVYLFMYKIYTLMITILCIKT